MEKLRLKCNEDSMEESSVSEAPVISETLTKLKAKSKTKDSNPSSKIIVDMEEEESIDKEAQKRKRRLQGTSTLFSLLPLPRSYLSQFRRVSF